MILVDAQGLEAHRPGRPLFDDLSVTLSSGDRLAVVGLNGCGKSTLLRQLSGAEEPAGGVVRRGRGSRIAVLDQDADAAAGDATLTVAEAVSGDWEGEAILERLGIGALRDRTVASLSGGQAKRVALARTLVEVGQVGHGDDAVLLILDEPTNHLDVDAIAWLEERLAQHRGGLLLVTHDRHLLDRVTNRILEIDRGQSYVHEGGYASYLLARAERDERAAVAEDVRQNLARRELAWLRRGAKARSRKSKARVTSATALIERTAEAEARPGSLELSAAAGGAAKGSGGLAGYTEAAARRRSGVPRLGEKVIELEGVGHRFGDGRWLFRDVELRLDPGERLAILGPNGAGKSTLSDIMAGRLVPTEGTVTIGPTVVLGVHRQQGPEIDPALTVREAVAGPLRQPDHDDARLMEQFWFDADVQHAPVGLLSGGERRRLQLLLTLAQRPNVLILDEPTNDLDLDTLRVLEDYLDDWPGAVVMVSHDRTFLERTVTDAVSLGDGRLKRVAGGVAAWAAERRVAPRPRRLASTTAVAPEDATTDPAPEPLAVASSGGLQRDQSDASSPVADQVVASAPVAEEGSVPPAHVALDVPSAGTSGGTSVARSPAPGDAGVAAATPRSASTLRFLLKDVDRDLRRLQRRRDELAAALSVATAAGDHVALAEVGREFANVEGELSKVEERWIELSLEAES